MFLKLLFLVVIGRVSSKPTSEYEQHQNNRLVEDQRQIESLVLVVPHPDFNQIQAAGFVHFADISKSSNAVLVSRDS
jgi:hypothetical protein